METRTSLAARIGGLTRHAMHGSAELSRHGQDALLARFEHEVDPECRLTESERRSRAEALRRAHMARLALRSAEARSKNKTGRPQSIRSKKEHADADGDSTASVSHA